MKFRQVQYSRKQYQTCTSPQTNGQQGSRLSAFLGIIASTRLNWMNGYKIFQIQIQLHWHLLVRRYRRRVWVRPEQFQRRQKVVAELDTDEGPDMWKETRRVGAPCPRCTFVIMSGPDNIGVSAILPPITSCVENPGSRCIEQRL